MDMAVGVIIGGAFSTITTSLTNDIIMPVVSIFLGGVDFSSMSVALPTFYPLAEDAMPNTLNYGSFISAVVNFLILSLVVFCIVKAVNRVMEGARKKGAKDVAVIGAQGVFIVNVPNNTVVTTMSQSDMKERVFTNIDSAVLM